MSFFNPQNPGIGGLDELTDAETELVQALVALGDPNADRILFWDDSAGQFQFLTAGSGLSISGTTITATGTIGGSTGATDNAILRANGTGGATIQSSGITIDDSNNTFLPTGTKLDWASGDVTVTHAVNTLTIAGISGNVSVNIGGGLITNAPIAIHDGTTLDFYSDAGTTFRLSLTGSAVGVLQIDHSTDAAFLDISGVAGKTFTFPDTTGTVALVTGTTDAVTVGTIELGHASDTTLSRAAAGRLAVEGVNVVTVSSTDTLSNKTLTSANVGTDIAPTADDGASLGTSSEGFSDLYLASGGNVLVANANAKRTIVLSAAGGWPSTTSGCATNTKVEAATNDVNYYTLDFDQTTQEYAEWTVVMPDNYDGSTITAIFYWTAASGTGDVIWAIQGLSLANDEAIDQAFGTAVTVTDTLIATGDVHVTSATSAVTLAGTPAGGELVAFKVYRDADAGGDTLSADARLMMVKIEYGINAYSD